MLLKRIFDLVVSLVIFSVLSWAIVLFWILAAIDTKSGGLFIQKRIGQYGKPFAIFKLRSIGEQHGKMHISTYGKFIRKTKIDEIPQLLNVIIGDMSLVGPRPDVPGYYDELQGENRKILNLKPGITSDAALKYTNEEAVLSAQKYPEQYNDEIIFPDKVKLNLHYYYKRSFFGDLNILARTVFSFIGFK